MKCRAKMIDGSPVTFEITPEEVVDRDGHPHLQQDAIGEGFFVRSVPYAYWGGVKYRDDRMRVALECSGVDTATVEYVESYVQHRADSRMPSDLRPNWEPLFPPVVKQPMLTGEPKSYLPGAITYIRIVEPTQAMIEAGWAALLDSPLYGEPRKAIQMIWRAMEKAMPR